MNDSACTQLEHAKARLIRLEHRLQQATTRMHAAAQSATAHAKRDYRDANAAASGYRSQIQTAINSIVHYAGECESLGSDPELLEEDIELARIAGNLALDGDEVVPFSEDEDFLAAESAASGFGADILYRAHLDPLTIMLQEAGYDILDVSPEARMEAQLRELEDAGFLGDFGAGISLPRSRGARQRLRRRLRRQKSRIKRRVRRLRNRTDPIGRNEHRRARRRLRRVEDRLEAVTASLAPDADASQASSQAHARRKKRRGRRGGSKALPMAYRSDKRPSTGPTAILPSLSEVTTSYTLPWLTEVVTSPTDFADLVFPGSRPPMPGYHPVRPGGAGGPALVTPLLPHRPGRRIPAPGRHATPEVLEAPSRGEFSTLLQGAATIAQLKALITRIRGAIRRSRGLSVRYQSRLNRDKARAAQIRRRITRARRRSRSLSRPGVLGRGRRRQLANIIRRLGRRLERVNQRVMDHTRLLALAARAVPAYQAHLKRAQAKIAALRASQAVQVGNKPKADAEAAKKEALEHDADVKEAAAEVATKVSNTTVVAADNEALRDAAESAQAELATKAEAGASGDELAELSQLVALLTEAINSQIPGLITSIGEISRMDLTPVFVSPAVPDPDVKPPASVKPPSALEQGLVGPTPILPYGPTAPLTAPTDIADVGIAVPPVSSGLSDYEIATGASRPYRVHPVSDPVGMAAQSYQDEREARLNAQLTMLATHGVDIGGDFGADTSFLDSHAPIGLWEDGPVGQFESGNVHMGSDPWDQFGYTPFSPGGASGFHLTNSSGGRFNTSFSSRASGAPAGGGGSGASGAAGGAAGVPQEGKSGGAGGGAGRLSFQDFGTGFGQIAGGVGTFLGNILPWVTGGQNQPAPSPQTVSNNQGTNGKAVTQMPPTQVIYTPGGSPMVTGQGGYSPPAEAKNYTPLYVAGGLGLVGLGIFAWASSR